MTTTNPYWHCTACERLNPPEATSCMFCGVLRYPEPLTTQQQPEPTSRKPTDTETLAHAMLSCGLATGHGESVKELAKEMVWQVRELREKSCMTDQESNNYCRILTALGCEEEGDPASEVENLIARVTEMEALK